MQDNHIVTFGHVKLRILDAEEQRDGYTVKDAGHKRYGVVEDLPAPYEHVGDPLYIKGDTVMIPDTGGLQYEGSDGETYIVFLQSEIKVIREDTEQQGISQF